MSLLNARTEFVSLTGRHDLVVDFAGADYDDNGANWFINRGVEYLDLIMPNPKSEREYKVDLAADAYVLTIERCIAVHEVWAANADGRHLLEEKTEKWMKDSYPTPYTTYTGALPKYWVHAKSELSPDLKALRSDTYDTQFTFDYQDTLFHTDGTPHYNKFRIIVMPPADEIYTMTVKGRFFAEALSADADENYWTYVHEDLVVLAAAMVMERTFRNFTGVKEYREEIMDKLSLIDSGIVDEESHNATEMEG